MKSTERFIHNLAKPFIEHDLEKCGKCLYESIKAIVAQEYIDKGWIHPDCISTLMEDIQMRWKKTPIYKRVKALQKEGRSLVEIRRLLELEGIEL